MQPQPFGWTGEQKFIGGSIGTMHWQWTLMRKFKHRPQDPMEVLLMALGACTATDIVIILERKRQKLVVSSR